MNLLVGLTEVSKLHSLGKDKKSKSLTRTFYSGRIYHNNKSEIDKLVKLIETQNTKLDSINSRFNVLENSLNVKTGMTSSAKTEGKINAIAHEYIRIGDKLFNKSKISKISFRESFMWRTFPYVVEMEYQKRKTEFLFGTANVMIPVNLDYEEHKFLYKDEVSAVSAVDDVMRACPHLKN